MGDDPLHGPVPGGFPAQVGPQDHGKLDVVASLWKLVLPPLGGGNAGVGFVGCVGGHTEEAEYGRALYCDATASRPL